MIPPPNAMKIVTFSELTASTRERLGGGGGGAPVVDEPLTGDVVPRRGDALLGQRHVARIGLRAEEVATVLHRGARRRTRAHERIEPDVVHVREQADAPTGQVDRERRRVSDALRALRR